jgi:hypothetical protein
MVGLSVIAFAQHGEQVRHDQQGCRRREQQAADDGARKCCVLFLAGAIAAAVISTGRIRVWPALSAASKAECPGRAVLT